ARATACPLAACELDACGSMAPLATDVAANRAPAKRGTRGMKAGELPSRGGTRRGGWVATWGVAPRIALSARAARALSVRTRPSLSRTTRAVLGSRALRLGRTTAGVRTLVASCG